ncbi:hypothetical protein [Methylobrevis pamukkalensis]|uniref:hypothetical protein n=1 Tax=Methylobrevis pamukkalensis TaxID=1439726 RepID=UPI000846168F|nr:hypothetical protein [Methylobrevis pamukkalensis]
MTDTTDETVMRSVTVPGGAPGIHGCVLVWALWSYTNSATAKTIRVRSGGLTGDIIVEIAPTTTATIITTRVIGMAGSLTSQVSFQASDADGIGTGSSGVTTGGQDYGADVVIAFTGQPGSTSANINLLRSEVWILHAA